MILNFELIFLLELHLDDVLEVLLVVGVEFLFYATCIMYIDTKGRFTEKIMNGGNIELFNL